MSTAVTPANDTAPLVISWDADDETEKFYVYMHFMEIQVLTRNQTRQFNIMSNGELWFRNCSPRYLHVETIYSTSAISGKQINFSLERTENSTLPPIISAIEIYRVTDLQKPQTFQADGIFHFLNPFIWFTLEHELKYLLPTFAFEKKLMPLQASSQFME